MRFAVIGKWRGELERIAQAEGLSAEELVEDVFRIVVATYAARERGGRRARAVRNG